MRGGIAIALGIAVVAAAVWLSVRDSAAPSSPVDPVDPGEERRGARTAEEPAGAEELPRAAVLGRVLTWEGDAAPGLSVRAAQRGRALPAAESGEDGWFEIAGLEAGVRVLLTVNGEPAALPVEELKPGEVRHVVIVLAGGDPHRVEVVDDEARPIPGAEVTAVRIAERLDDRSWIPPPDEAPLPGYRATTDGEGRAVLPPLGAGNWLLVARRDGYATGFDYTGRFPGWAGDGNETRILLSRRADLAGRVTDSAGRALAGVRVHGRREADRCYPRESDPWRPWARTDARGGYRLEGLPAGRTTIVATRPCGPPRDVSVVHLPLVERFDIVLPVGGVLRGRITDEVSGQPVAGARVVAEVGTFSHAWERPRYGAETRTDGAGRYEITGMPVGSVDQLRVSRVGYRQYEIGLSHDLRMVEGVPVVWDVALARGATIEGTVTGPDGPVPGAVVTFDGVEGDWKETCQAFADRYGRFRITTLEPGRWTVDAGGEEVEVLAEPGKPVSVALEVDPGGSDEPDRGVHRPVPDERPLIRISGVVRAADGTVPAGARVLVTRDYGSDPWGEEPLRWIPPGFRTREDGSYEGGESTYDSGWRFRILAGAPGYAPSAPIVVEEEPGRTEYRADVTLDRGHDVLARVTDAASGSPVAGASACLLVHDGEWSVPDWMAIPSPPVVHAVSGPDGRIAIPNVPAGTYRLCVSAVGTLGGNLVLEVPGAEAAEIALAPALSLGGVVRFPDGSSPGPVEIWLEPEGDGEIENFHTAGNGRFFIRGLRAGRYRVGVRRIIGHGPVNFLEREPEVFEAGRTDLVLKVARGYRMAGVVRDEQGAPVPHLFVDVTDDEGDRPGDTEMVDEDGRFEVVGLPEGAYVVEIEKDGFLPFRREGVRAGSEDLVFVLSRGHSISGVLVDEGGKPLEHHVLAAMDPKSTYRPDREDPQAVTGPNGAFTIEGLTAGTYEIRARSGHSIWTADEHYQYEFVLLGETAVAAGTAGVRLVASPGVALTGRVVSEVGDPVPGAEVDCDEEDSWREADGEADGDGRFRVDHLHPDRSYTVRVKARGRLDTRIEKVRPPRELTVTLMPGLVLSGRALSADGTPLRNWELWFGPRGEGRSHETQTDGAGRFTLKGLRAGTYRVSARLPADYDNTLDLGEVEAGEEGVVLRPR